MVDKKTQCSPFYVCTTTAVQCYALSTTIFTTSSNVGLLLAIVGTCQQPTLANKKPNDSLSLDSVGKFEILCEHNLPLQQSFQ